MKCHISLRLPMRRKDRSNRRTKLLLNYISRIHRGVRGGEAAEEEVIFCAAPPCVTQCFSGPPSAGSFEPPTLNLTALLLFSVIVVHADIPK